MAFFIGDGQCAPRRVVGIAYRAAQRVGRGQELVVCIIGKGIRPAFAVRNTDDVAHGVIADLGYQAVLCRRGDDPA